MAFGMSAGAAALTGAIAGPVIGGLIGSAANRQAVSAQADAAAQSDATQRYMYDTTRADNAPFREAGLEANNRLLELMKSGQFDRRFTAQDLENDPVYQSGLKFGLDQGTQGINRQAAAGGSFLSGATLKALTKYGNDYGSTKANESYNRFNTDQTNQYNRYAGLSGAGQQATNQVSAAGANMANNISASQQGLGNARGSSYIAQGNSLVNALNDGYSNYQNNKLLNYYMNRNANPFGSVVPGPGIDASSYQA